MNSRMATDTPGTVRYLGSVWPGVSLAPLPTPLSCNLASRFDTESRIGDLRARVRGTGQLIAIGEQGATEYFGQSHGVVTSSVVILERGGGTYAQPVGADTP